MKSGILTGALPDPIDFSLRGDITLILTAVSMSVISPLSEKSIGSGSAPVKIPDFTRGKWEKNKPIFGLNDQA